MSHQQPPLLDQINDAIIAYDLKIASRYDLYSGRPEAQPNTLLVSPDINQQIKALSKSLPRKTARKQTDGVWGKETIIGLNIVEVSDKGADYVEAAYLP